MAATIEVTEDQVLYFRARRGHLAGPGAPNAAAAARAIVGAQSQQLPPSLLALSLRTKGRPTASQLKKQLFEQPPKLVRTWGQRGTLFIYDPRVWCHIATAREDWGQGARGGPMPAAGALDKALKKITGAGRPVSRTDLLGVAPKSYENALAERAAMANMDPKRLAAARLIWMLSHRGDVCVADKVGTEQTYVARAEWFPKLAWKPKTTGAACAELTKMYMAVHGPATVNDVAYFFGAKVSTAKEWVGAIDGKLTPVKCGDRKGLIALTEDVKDLRAKPPASATAWPLRLLPLWEAMMMGHTDKSWTVPVDAERKLIWRKAAYVCAVVLARGRVVAIWSHKEKRKRLAVEVQPLSGWRKTKHEAGVRKEAEAVAAHLELEGAEVKIA